MDYSSFFITPILRDFRFFEENETITQKMGTIKICYPLTLMKNTRTVEKSIINHLLVIDDDYMTDILIGGISTNISLINRYVFKTNGWAALEYLSFCKKTNDFPTLIILDVRMPQMSGLEFLERYQHLFYPDFQETKIVVATNSTTNSEKQAAIAFPSIEMFLNKPLGKEKFIYMYETLFGLGID